MSGSGWTRRGVLGAGALSPIMRIRPASAAPAALRVAALDWALASTAAALGAGPAAVGECAAYRRWVRAPDLPADVVELGLRTSPSLETLVALQPDLILINDLNLGLRSRLERIAPVWPNAIYTLDHAPVARAIAATRALGARLDRSAEAEALIGTTAARVATARARLGERVHRPLLPIGFIDARHVRAYGAGSLFADVMDRIGLTCGWSASTNAWGFGLAGLEALATSDADLLIVEPIPTDARRGMEGPGLWRSLVETGSRRVLSVPPIWAFGDLTAAGRCADLLAEVLAPSQGDAAPREGDVDPRVP